MPNNLNEICVVICTYNTKKLTLECLQKLKKSINFLGKSVEVIVVENGTDGTGDAIKKRYPWVEVVTPKTNTGFAKGNNLGVRSSSGKAKYYLFLNTDALIKKETLKKSVEFIEKRNDHDVFGCRLMLGNGKMQPSAGFLPTPFSAVTWILGIDLIPAISELIPQFHPKFKSFFERNRKVGWVMGAYLFMKREVYEKTNGFDEGFFMYMEEVDWCRRIREVGFDIYYVPNFSITHLDKASVGGDWRKPTIREIQGSIYYLGKYFPKSRWWLIPVIKFALVLRRFAFWVVGNHNRSDIYREVLETL